MSKPTYHLFLCSSFRKAGVQRGTCHRKGDGLLQYLEEGVVERGIDALVSSTGCVKHCEKGPVLMVYPMGWWYGSVTEDAVDDILDALEDGNSCDGLLHEAHAEGA